MIIAIASIVFSTLINFLFVKKIRNLEKQETIHKERIENLYSYSKNLALAVNEIQNYLLQQENTNKTQEPFFKLPKGEA